MQTHSSEFRIIHQYFQQHARYDNSVSAGIGDDCAIINATPGMQQAVSVDTSIADRHFPSDAAPFLIARRALNVSLSDLAAMGAQPRWFTLALNLPQADELWLKAFSEGLFSAADEAGIQLIGGDTTKANTLAITVQVHGELPAGTALLRRGANAGETVYVSGQLGNAAAGLAQYRQGIREGELFNAYMNPQPQLALGRQLRGIASSCIDISDGLLADLGHILAASGCAARVDAAKLPLAPAALQAFTYPQVLRWALGGGDDYQLCFTSALSASQLQQRGITAYAIGTLDEGSGCQLLGLPRGMTITTTGFDHFYEPAI